MEKEKKKIIIFIVSIAAIIALFFAARNIQANYLQNLGVVLPLPIFTFAISFVDGFNPCNLFVLTFLLALLTSASHSRKRIFTIGYIFVFVIFVIYFIFMAAWLNIFRFIGFINPLRITIAIIALVAGLINCKELFFFRKGITLMIRERHKAPLIRKIKNMKDIIKKGSMSALISSSIILALFSSLVELPCTAGFPIIYTAILTGKVLEHSFMYYIYLAFYNFVYVMPLAVIIFIFGTSLKAKQISKEQMEWIKFIGGIIMIALGIILIVNPGLIGIGG